MSEQVCFKLPVDIYISHFGNDTCKHSMLLKIHIGPLQKSTAPETIKGCKTGIFKTILLVEQWWGKLLYESNISYKTKVKLLMVKNNNTYCKRENKALSQLN